MTRLLATVRADVVLQSRNGFYAATAVVTAAWALALTQAGGLDWGWLLPPLVVGNLLIGTFYFLAGVVLLERGEGSVRAQAVTPLRAGEYLWSKVLTLTALALAETLVIAALVRGGGFDVLALAAGCALAGVIYCLAGFVAVVRYPSISAFLLPSGAIAALLWVPLLAYMAEWRPALLYLHPLMAPLSLVEASLGRAPWWQVPYGLVYGAVWVIVLFAWARRAHRRWLVERGGE